MRAWVLFLVLSLPIYAGAKEEKIPADLEEFIEVRDPSSKVKKEAIGNDSAGGELTEEAINAKLKEELSGLSETIKEEPPPKTFEVTTLFSSEQNPGYGTLIFTQGQKGEEIKFGPDTGHFGYGVVFRSSLLPQPHRSEFGKKLILQFSLGTLRNRLGGRTPQFGAITIFARRVPTRPKTFKLRTAPKGRGGLRVRDGGVLLISSPNARQEQGDEEKLRGTYFVKSGRIILSPSSDIKTSSTVVNGERLRFKAQMIELQFEASLLTPFNNQVAGGLDGKVTIPLYWPANEAAREIMADLAAQSLDDTGALPKPPAANRGLSGGR